MPSTPDFAVLIVLALLLFGPKKLPVLARQLGKLMNDFRRASNEFRTQMEEELRISEQVDRQKQIAAIDTSSPETVPPFDPGPMPELPHEPPPAPSFASPSDSPAHESASHYMVDSPFDPVAASPESVAEQMSTPIATSGELSIMPPSTGLPIANSSPHNGAAPAAYEAQIEAETETLHG